MQFDVQSLIQIFHAALLVKLIFLVLIGLSMIFIIMLQYQLRSLRRIVLFPSRAGSLEIQTFAIFYLGAFIVLFIAIIFIA